MIVDLQRLDATSQQLVLTATTLPPDEETLILTNDAEAARSEVLELLRQAEAGLTEVQSARGTLTEQQQEQDRIQNLLAAAEAWLEAARDVTRAEPATGDKLLQQIQAHQVRQI